MFAKACANAGVPNLIAKYFQTDKAVDLERQKTRRRQLSDRQIPTVDAVAAGYCFLRKPPINARLGLSQKHCTF